jgi:hypothetical protein
MWRVFIGSFAAWVIASSASAHMVAAVRVASERLNGDVVELVLQSGTVIVVPRSDLWEGNQRMLDYCQETRLDTLIQLRRWWLVDQPPTHHYCVFLFVRSVRL